MLNNAKIANASIDAAKIIDGQITNAKIGNTIQSNNYVPN
ncbi:phage tail tip fiber protein, partial [Serratia sp. IR-2025]